MEKCRTEVAPSLRLLAGAVLTCQLITCGGVTPSPDGKGTSGTDGKADVAQQGNSGEGASASTSAGAPNGAPGTRECPDPKWSKAGDIVDICADYPWTCTAPDCNGGVVKVPYWLRGVDYWSALCVHATGKREIISYGDSFIKYEQALSGEPGSQIYYSLSQPPPIDIGRKLCVWSVCGGGGGELARGTRVLVAPGLPDSTAIKIAEAVAELTADEDDLQLFRDSHCKEQDPVKKAAYLEKVTLMRKAINEATLRLRTALITEHSLLMSH